MLGHGIGACLTYNKSKFLTLYSTPSEMPWFINLFDLPSSIASSLKAEIPFPVPGLPPTQWMFAEQMKWPLFILYSCSFLRRHYSKRKHAWHAWKNMTSWRGWSGGPAHPFEQGDKLSRQEILGFPLCFRQTFPREWTLPSDPAGRKRGGCSRSSDTMEREGVPATEVTQWLELQDASGKQEGRGSSKPWNPDLLKEASNTAAVLEPGEQPPPEVTETLGFGKRATWFLHWKWRVKNTFWGESKM